MIWAKRFKNTTIVFTPANPTIQRSHKNYKPMGNPFHVCFHIRNTAFKNCDFGIYRPIASNHAKEDGHLGKNEPPTHCVPP